MTTSSDLADGAVDAATPSPFVPSGHPVRRFVTAIAVVAGLLAAVAYVGPFSARTEVWVSAWTVDDDRVTAVVALTNTGRFTVEATDFDAPELVAPLPLREYLPTADDEVGAGEPIGSITIDPGETVNVAVVITCADRVRTDQLDIALDRPHVDVEVAFGLTRTAWADWAVSFGTDCPTG